jgi:hypothetical protein
MKGSVRTDDCVGLDRVRHRVAPAIARALERQLHERDEGTMTSDLDPEAIDLATLAGALRRVCGPSVTGAVMGRTRLRDEVARHLECSQMMSEDLVDTMIARGFIRQQVHPDGWVYWSIA